MIATSIQQHAVPAERLGELVEFTGEPTDTTTLNAQLDLHGYLLLRGVLDRERVLAARAEVFERLASVGEIAEPAAEGIATGASSRESPAKDGGEFWRSVSEGPLLRALTHGDRIHEIMQRVFGEAARGFDLMYLRPAPVDRSTRLHYDHPFFAGSADRIVTAWIPLGDVPVGDGPLVIVEGSNRFDDLLDPIRHVDYGHDRSEQVVQQAAYSKQNETDPVTLAIERDTRLLTTDFAAGDLVIFNMFTMHGSLDNRSATGRVRLSCDVRFQAAAEPADDDRYFGPQPQGSKGGGYADMKGARPLTEPW